MVLLLNQPIHITRVGFFLIPRVYLGPQSCISTIAIANRSCCVLPNSWHNGRVISSKLMESLAQGSEKLRWWPQNSDDEEWMKLCLSCIRPACTVWSIGDARALYNLHHNYSCNLFALRYAAQMTILVCVCHWVVCQLPCRSDLAK
jgi:hypothetical protein